jgi:hypothetical protein
VIDLSSIHDEDVKAIVAELILRKIAHYIESGKRSMAPTSQKWFIIVDEAWRLLKPSEDGRHRTKLEWLYRVGRNWNVGIVALTQLWSDIGKIASNADLQVHLSIADAETVEQLVEYTGLQKLRQLGPQLPKHAALILNRSTTDDLERLAAATLYQGRAKIWVVAEMFRLYLPSWQVKRVQREIMEEREAINARLNEISAQVLVRGVKTTEVSNSGVQIVNEQEATKLSKKECGRGLGIELVDKGNLQDRDAGVSEGSRREEPVPRYDPLKKVISVLKAKCPGNYNKEEVLAACLLLSNGAYRDGRLDLESINTLMMDWLVKKGVCDSENGMPKFAFEKLVKKLASLEIYGQFEEIAKLTCPYCFTYPITPSHVCPSKGGGLHE